MKTEFRARKILGQMTCYRDVNMGAMLPPWLAGIELPPGNRLLGVYENTPGSTNDYVAVSDHGLLVVTPEGERVFVAYHDILRAPYNNEKKETIDGLILETRQGTRVPLPVKNGERRFRDVFEFSRFVDRAAAQSLTDRV